MMQFFIARFEVPNPQHILKLQMTAQIKIQLELHKNVLIVPLSALREKIAANQYRVAIKMVKKCKKSRNCYAKLY